MVSNNSFRFLGDVEEAYENSKKIAENPHVDILKVCRLSSINHGSFENGEIWNAIILYWEIIELATSSGKKTFQWNPEWNFENVSFPLSLLTVLQSF